MKTPDNPMRSAHVAPRCTARSKRTGEPCRGPAVRGWSVCRMHGARGGAPEGFCNGRFRTGTRTRMFERLRRLNAELSGAASELLKGLR